MEADRQIPGAGIHSSVWAGSDKYDYPFDYEFEGVLRPLRYIPTYLSLDWGDRPHPCARSRPELDCAP